MLKSANWLALMCSLSPSSAEAYRFVLLPTDNTINLCNSGSAVRWRVSVGSDPKSRCCYWEACGRAGGSQTFLIKKKNPPHQRRQLSYRANLLRTQAHLIRHNRDTWKHKSVGIFQWLNDGVCVCVFTIRSHSSISIWNKETQVWINDKQMNFSRPGGCSITVISRC